VASARRRVSVTLGDDQLLSLTTRGDVLNVLPHLLHYRPKRAGKQCAKCTKGSRNAAFRRDALRAIKEALQHLWPEQAEKLKQVLNVQEIVFHVRVDRGTERRTI